jgi:hypothetical protein
MREELFEFKVDKEGNSIVGFTLRGMDDEVWNFCLQFPRAYFLKKAEVFIEEDKIVFICSSCYPNELHFTLKNKAIKELRKKLNRNRMRFIAIQINEGVLEVIFE